jgi:hypothetical protein
MHKLHPPALPAVVDEGAGPWCRKLHGGDAIGLKQQLCQSSLVGGRPQGRVCQQDWVVYAATWGRGGKRSNIRNRSRNTQEQLQKQEQV